MGNIILKNNSEYGKAVEEQIQEAASGGAHLCYDYTTVYPEYPVRWCTQSGGHLWEPKDSGQGQSWVSKALVNLINLNNLE